MPYGVDRDANIVHVRDAIPGVPYSCPCCETALVLHAGSIKTRHFAHQANTACDGASDRAHRMGQQRPATIYRLVARHTIEESIVDLHQHKRDLADSLLEGSDLAGKMSAPEMLGLLQQELG
ncbi:MAG: competence protein CoiA family protein [Noviherbaspirillum sp.]